MLQKVLHRSECDIRENFDTNEYQDIFVSKNLHERMSEYIHIKNLTRTNVQIDIGIENCANNRIYLNIRHTLAQVSKKGQEGTWRNKCPHWIGSKVKILT